VTQDVHGSVLDVAEVILSVTERRAPNAGTTYPASTSVTKAGWAAGGGIEYAMTNNWSAKLEGLYFDLGHATTVGEEVPLTFPPFGFTHTKEFDLQYALVRLGINYKFSPFP
jgi:outer membrane immunogenic protein